MNNHEKHFIQVKPQNGGPYGVDLWNKTEPQKFRAFFAWNRNWFIYLITDWFHCTVKKRGWFLHQPEGSLAVGLVLKRADLLDGHLKLSGKISYNTNLVLRILRQPNKLSFKNHNLNLCWSDYFISHICSKCTEKHCLLIKRKVKRIGAGGKLYFGSGSAFSFPLDVDSSS